MVKKSVAHKAPKKPAKVVHPKAPVSFRRNFLPPILGLVLGLGVFGLLNGQWLVAQYQYRFVAPVVQAAPAETTLNAQAPAQIYIPKIQVAAPIVTDVKSYEATPVQLALRKGVLQYGSSADPGQIGNLVVVGHSSGQLWAPGDYKFVFTLLNKLVKDDRILIDFKGQRYIYRVSSTRIVPPTDISVLQNSSKPQLTLITCTPVGTSKDRLVVFARQISPNPDTNTPLAEAKVQPVTTESIPN